MLSDPKHTFWKTSSFPKKDRLFLMYYVFLVSCFPRYEETKSLRSSSWNARPALVPFATSPEIRSDPEGASSPWAHQTPPGPESLGGNSTEQRKTGTSEVFIGAQGPEVVSGLIRVYRLKGCGVRFKKRVGGGWNLSLRSDMIWVGML